MIGEMKTIPALIRVRDKEGRNRGTMNRPRR